MSTNIITANEAVPVYQPRFKGLVLMYSIACVAFTMAPILTPAGGEFWESSLCIYHLVGFSPVGVVYMIGPLLMVYFHRQPMTVEAKMMRYFLIFIAGAASFGFCLKEAFVWMMETTGELPTIEDMWLFYLILWIFEMALVFRDARHMK